MPFQQNAEICVKRFLNVKKITQFGRCYRTCVGFLVQDIGSAK